MLDCCFVIVSDVLYLESPAWMNKPLGLLRRAFFYYCYEYVYERNTPLNYTMYMCVTQLLLSFCGTGVCQIFTLLHRFFRAEMFLSENLWACVLFRIS